jgi:DHA1 family multidrug resistance protein-like MFS transporter
MVAAPLLPISLFWLGWTDYATISVYSGLSACFCFGIVLNAMYVSSYEYIIDSYGEKAALGLAGVTMMRYIVAGGMVIAARPMYEKIGVHWTMTLLGCVALVLTPAPYVLFKRGTELRRKSPHASNVSSGNKEET